MKKTALNFLAVVLVPFLLRAQVPRRVVVEHFSNSYCSVCSAKNPGFYANLSNFPQVVHVAYHPSSPYPACQLNKHNVTQNDARTNYYGVYGSTPRVVIQGSVIPAVSNLSAPSLLSPFLGMYSPFKIQLMHSMYGTDSVVVTARIKNAAAHNFTNPAVYVAILEDTVFYTGGNGENKHFDVFRKFVDGAAGEVLNLGSQINDSMDLRFSSVIHPAWNGSRIKVLLMLQETNSKELLQSEVSTVPSLPMSLPPSGGMDEPAWSSYSELGNLYIISDNNCRDCRLELTDLSGKVLTAQPLRPGRQLVGLYQQGLYLLRISNSTGYCTVRKLAIN